MADLDITLAPLVPWPLLILAGVIAAILVGIAATRRGRGVWLRAGALGLLIASLVNPSVVRKDTVSQPDVAVVIVDESPSQGLGNRRAQTLAARRHLEDRLGHLDDLEVKVAEVGADPAGAEGTRLFTGLERALTPDVAERLAGVVMITDGQVHDVPDGPLRLPAGAPLHVLLTGDRNERDRRLVVEHAPAYGLIGAPVDVTFRVEDVPAPGEPRSARVRISVDGMEDTVLPVPVGTSVTHAIMIDHAGSTVLELEAEALPGEISPVNNRALVTVHGVRDRLRVLLVSGQPHMGERTWRNLLKSDPAVDLVHFTILRPPEKDDPAPIHELSLIAFPVRELFEEQLDNFDLVVFDRYVVRNVLPWHYLERTVEYVRDGGAILLANGPEFAGFNSLYRTPLGRVMPALPSGRLIEQAYRPRVTGLGRRHPVTAALPGEEVVGDADDHVRRSDRPEWGPWFRIVETEVRGGHVLMEGADQRPLLVVDRVGDGRIAQLLSDHVWLWARGYDGGGPHAELIRRLAHWLMKEPELEEERLTARIEDGRLLVTRRSLGRDPLDLTVTAPDGTEQRLQVVPAGDGVARAEAIAEAFGLYRVSDDRQTVVVAAGPSDPLEFRDLVATSEHLAGSVRSAGGGLVWLEDGLPELRRVSPERTAAGRGWLGFQRTEATVVTGIKTVSLLPPLLALTLALAALAGAWWREGR
ncbi:MAG: hypothetical protein EA406_01060 [Rhodospirillales bacterium]|nr:MAG: hypothetical protein EA406_01060 [Rhodospirillales bacterium]